MEQFAEQLNDFIHSEKIEFPYVFGYSMGGYVALLHVVKYPGAIQKIFTLGTKFDWNVEFAQKQKELLQPEKLLAKVPEYAASLEKTHRPEDWKKVVLATADMMIQLGNKPLLNDESLRQVNIPVVIGWGAKDFMVSKEESLNYAAMIPDAEMKTLPETPHPIEKVEYSMLAEELTAFFT